VNRTVILLPLLLLSACATPEPKVRTVTVDRPVAVSCIPAALDPAQPFPDTDEALRGAVDAAERYALVAAGRLLRDARLGELEPIILLCRDGASK
jgi:hypothetical protein